jgi:hypothetical protein
MHPLLALDAALACLGMAGGEEQLLLKLRVGLEILLRILGSHPSSDLT